MVRENMGVPTEDIWKRVNKSLEAVGMTAFRHRSPNKLSGGREAACRHCRSHGNAPQMYCA